MTELIITARDVKAASMCITPGAKMFFKRHDLDFRDFIKNGISAEKLIATGDALALEVVRLKQSTLNESKHGQE